MALAYIVTIKDFFIFASNNTSPAYPGIFSMLDSVIKIVVTLFLAMSSRACKVVNP